MGEYRLSTEAEADLDGIWSYIAHASGSIDAANRVIDSITERFWLLASHPRMGRVRLDLRPGLRSFTAGDYVIVHRLEKDDTVVILCVLRGERDIVAMLAP